MNQVFLWFKSGTLKLIFWAGFVLLLWGTFSPVSTLVWWLKHDPENLKSQRDRLQRQELESQSAAPSGASEVPVNCYIVLLTGVGDFSAKQLAPGQQAFLDRLTAKHPNCAGVGDVYPYSAANESLDGEDLLQPLWEAARKADGWFENAYVIIKIRNFWRFALSIDDRYGPVYNRGVANAIVNRMDAAYPIEETQGPLTLILMGTSGGAQVALGAADYLDQEWVNRLVVVSIGGDFSGAEGFTAVDQVYHLQGRQDWIEDLSRFIFPQRWPWTVGSAFNKAQHQNRYHTLISGPHAHSGPTGYFGLDPVQPNSDKTYLDFTLEKVNQLPIWQ
jgi:hypothetical protein